MLTVKDLEQVQAKLGNDYRIELVDGEIVVMSPSGYESDEVASEFGRQLGNWTRPRQLGRVTGAGAGFVLPNSDTPLFRPGNPSWHFNSSRATLAGNSSIGSGVAAVTGWRCVDVAGPAAWLGVASV